MCELRVPATRFASLRADETSGRSLLTVLFGPDPVVPEQWVEGARRDSTMSGEKALLLAVLKDGIRCFQERRPSRCPSPHALAAEAEAWITAVDDEQPCSFQNICEVLGFDPGRVRARLLASKAIRGCAAETGDRPTLREPTGHGLNAPHASARAPSPLTAGRLGVKRCAAVSREREPTPRRADASADVPRQAG